MIASQRQAYAMAQAIAEKEMKKKAALERRKQRDQSHGLSRSSSDCSKHSNSNGNDGVWPAPKPSRKSLLKAEAERKRKCDELVKKVKVVSGELLKERENLEYHKKDLEAIIVVHRDRARARHSSNNETGTLISLRRIKKSQVEIDNVNESLKPIQQQLEKINGLLLNYQEQQQTKKQQIPKITNKNQQYQSDDLSSVSSAKSNTTTTSSLLISSLEEILSLDVSECRSRLKAAASRNSTTPTWSSSSSVMTATTSSISLPTRSVSVHCDEASIDHFLSSFSLQNNSEAFAVEVEYTDEELMQEFASFLAGKEG